MDINIQKTHEVKTNPNYIKYVKWVQDNGCVFPNVFFI